MRTYQEGKKASEEKKSLEANPHKPGSYKHRIWAAGWLDDRYVDQCERAHCQNNIEVSRSTIGPVYCSEECAEECATH